MPRLKNTMSFEEKKQEAFRFFVEKGYTPAQAAGIVGNLVWESSMDTTIKGDKNTSDYAVGLAQWRLDRKDNLRRRYGDGWTDFYNQLDFVDWELKNTHKFAYNQMLKADSPEEVALVIAELYEAPRGAKGRSLEKLRETDSSKWPLHTKERQANALKLYQAQDQNIYSTDSRGQIVTVNPEYATPQQIQQSEMVKNQFYNNYLTNLGIPTEITTFANDNDFVVTEDETTGTTIINNYYETPKEEKEEKPEVSEAQQRLQAKKAERQFLVDLVSSGAFDLQAPQYNRTSIMKDGGKVRIIDYDGNEREIATNSKEYRDMYEAGDIVLKEGEDEYKTSLPEVIISKNHNKYPFFDKLSPQEKEYIDDDSPIGRQIRARATDGVGFNADKAAKIPGQILQGAGSALQVPQSMMVEGIEALRGNEYDFKSAWIGNDQRLPSDAWGYENPEGFWQNAANIFMDAVVDPTLVTGAGAVGKNVIRKGARGATKKAVKNIDDFKSEIDWAKWNPDTPKHTELLREYNAIEKATKESGTWMKNPDGSNFRGAPEQFIQQQSNNFKKAFGETKVVDDYGNPKIVSHTTDAVFDTFDISKFGKTDDGFYGKGFYFGDYFPVSHRPDTFKPVLSYGDIDMPSYINIKNPIIENAENFDNTATLAGRFGRQGKTNHPVTNKIVDTETLWKNRYDGVMVSPEHKFNAEYVVEKPNQIKSAVGNVGFFDMTNPNIYKALVPAVATGAATQMQGGGKVNTEKENKEEEESTNTKYVDRSFNNIVEKQAYWDGLESKYGKHIKGRQNFLDDLDKRLPPINIKTTPIIRDTDNSIITIKRLMEGKTTGFNSPEDFEKGLKTLSEKRIQSQQKEGSLKEIIANREIGKNTKSFLAASILAEGGDEFVDYVTDQDELYLPEHLDGYKYFGLDTIYDRADEFIKKGYLDKDFKKRIEKNPITNEKGEKHNSAYFTNYDDIIDAKLAFYKDASKKVENIAKREDINLSDKAKDFFIQASFITGEGNARKMLLFFKERGYLENDKFLDKNFEPSSWKTPYNYTMRKVQAAQMIQDEGFFN